MLSSASNNPEILMPQYKWLYTVTLNMNWKPYTDDFDITELDIDPKFFKWWSQTLKATYFEIPRTYVWGAILIIFLLFIAFRKKKEKIVYIQQK